MTGAIEIDVLNAGGGHFRLTFVPGDPEETTNARAAILTMLHRGFTILVMEHGVPVRVTDFDPDRGVYYVEDGPADEAVDPGVQAPTKKRGRKKREIPVKGSKATAIGRTAGG